MSRDSRNGFTSGAPVARIGETTFADGERGASSPSCHVILSYHLRQERCKLSNRRPSSPLLPPFCPPLAGAFTENTCRGLLDWKKDESKIEHAFLASHLVLFIQPPVCHSIVLLPPSYRSTFTALRCTRIVAPTIHLSYQSPLPFAFPRVARPR